MKDKIMARLNENGLIIPLVMVFGLVGLMAMIILVFSADLAKSAETPSITVTALVETSVGCDAAPSSMTFPTLTTAQVETATGALGNYASTTMSCNYGLGCTLSVYDVGDGVDPGLASDTPAALIQSVTELLVAGTEEGYGLQATTTAAGTGGTLTIDATFDKTGNYVGGMVISSPGADVASSSEAISNKEVLITHKAAIYGLTAAANYVDSITYSCLGNL